MWLYFCKVFVYIGIKNVFRHTDLKGQLAVEDKKYALNHLVPVAMNT